MDDQSTATSSSSLPPQWPKNDTISPSTTTCFSHINDDLLQNIISKLTATSFASAACVNKSWNRICNRLLSRPKLVSALSLHPSHHIAVREVLDKVLAEPIRPHFAIANVGSGYPLFEVLKLMSKRLGSKTPMVISTASCGIIGRDAITDKFKEVEWLDIRGFNDEDDPVTAKHVNYGIVLTVGYVPGLKVDAVPLLRSTKEPEHALDCEFISDIKDYTFSVSGSTSPVGIILFGEGLVDIERIIYMLDYAMPLDTVIVGDEKGRFLYISSNESRNVCGSAKYLTDAVALVFAKDKEKSCGNIQFNVGLSNGVSAVGPKYKAVYAREGHLDRSTTLTARIEGHQTILGGHRILNDINNGLEDHIDFPDLYIGVKKPGKCSLGSEKPRLVSSLEFHAVLGGNDKYLFVDGDGLKSDDCIQFYRFDPDTALSSREVFGGFIFSYQSCRRIKFELSTFAKNFPGLPLAGVFCRGEIGRGSISLEKEGRRGRDGQYCLHVHGAVYLVMSYTPAPLEF